MDAVMRLVGLEEVKDKFLRTVYRQRLRVSRNERDLDTCNFNARFEGNPGTGMFSPTLPMALAFPGLVGRGPRPC
jgi:hypothetical protein